MNDKSEEQLKKEKKSRTGLLLGGITLMAGAIICLIYIWFFKPWKIETASQSAPIPQLQNIQSH